MNNLKNLRKRKGLSIAQLHRMTGYPVRTLEDWDSNKRQITSYHRIKRLSAILDCQMDELMTKEEKCKFGGKNAFICLFQEEDGVVINVYIGPNTEEVFETIISRDKALKLLKYMKNHVDVKPFFEE